MRAVVLAFVVCGTAAAQTAQPPRVVRIDSIMVDRTPVVRHDSLFFTLFCFCKGLPGNYWYYFDRLQGALTIEVLESGVNDYDIKFPSYSPIRRLRARTMETGMALTRTEARFMIEVDKGKTGMTMWGNSVSLLGNRGFSVTIGKPMADPLDARHKKSTRIFAVVTAISIALLAVTAGLALILNLNSGQ
jgi:hypothetical protein